MALEAMTDTDFYAHKRAVDVEASRRTRRDAITEQIAAYIAENGDQLQGPRGPEGPYGGTEITDAQLQAALSDRTTITGEWASVALRRGVNVLEYGAVGDGIADDTQALTDALAAIANGGTLHITVPLRTTGQVDATLPGDRAKRIVFTENGSITADFDTRGDAIISITGSRSVHFQDVRIIGSGPGQSLDTSIGIYGIHVTDSENVSVAGGSVTNTHREGLYFKDVAGVDVIGVLMSDNTFSMRMGAIQLIRTQDTLITRCTVTRSGWKGISASTCDRIAITDNTVHDIAGGDAILAGGCTDFRIVSNTISGVGWDTVEKAGDAIKTTEAKAGDGLASSHGVIASNTIRDIQQQGAGIRLTATRHTIVTGNDMTDVTNIGIPIASSVSLDVPIHSTDLMIVGNKLTNIGAHGIYVGPDSERITITGNNVDTCDPGSGVLISGGTEIVTTQNTVVRTTQPAVRYLRDDITGVARDNTTPASETSVGPLVQSGRLEENIREIDSVRPLTGADAGAILLVDASGTMTLPHGTELDAGWNVTIKNLSMAPVVVERSGGNTIDGAASVTVAPNDAVQIVRRNASVYTVI